MNDEAIYGMVSTLSPHNVTSYLRSRKWVVSEISEGRRISFVYQVAGEYYGGKVVVPLSVLFTDFGILMFGVIESLYRVEGRSMEIIVEDIQCMNTDLCRFRWVDTSLPPGEIPLVGAARLLDGAREMLAAAALSVIRPRPYYTPGRPPTEVFRFLREARVSAAYPGSYIVTVKTRVTPSFVQPLTVKDEENDIPFSRRVMSRLVCGLQTCRLYWAMLPLLTVCQNCLLTLRPV